MNLRQKIAIGALSGALGIAGAVVTWFEGRSLVAYLDPVGIPTICDGWTYRVQLGDTATPEQCDAYTRKALEETARIFERWVPTSVIEQMPTTSVAAFQSFIYNVGPGAPGVKDGFVWLKSGRHSTMLLHLQAGRVAAACSELPNWPNAGGKRLRGLEIRRAAERELCEVGL
ncbi:lysozyme [Pseudomonas sp. B392_1p]|uniref:lysozyme n=1 Tax=Pseudomonas sp. B392_1p TaxID=3457507 RepID=UPI003FD0B372